jgi:hypothetical protein
VSPRIRDFLWHVAPPNRAGPSVLYFATHGFVFDHPKIPPILALHRRGVTTDDDGRLTLDDVYGLRLDTDLVVLSACRSGAGKVSSDGVIGLTRGFFYAGTPSVLATFWDVTDELTASLIARFYRNYARKSGKGASHRGDELTEVATGGYHMECVPWVSRRSRTSSVNTCGSPPTERRCS